MKQYSYIYILSNKINSTLYIGVTGNLVKRIFEHKQKLVDGFTKKYNMDKLVYFEQHESISDAITKEKQLKGGSRKKKIELIEKLNPEWNDLYESIIG